MKYFILFSLFLIGVRALAELEVQFGWTEVSFSWPNDAVKNESINNGDYVPENNLPLGLALWKNKLFVTVPRWKAGVAASLTYIDLNATNETSPVLTPYPDWETHNLRNYSSETIVSPFRLQVDRCDRLWFVDTGKADLHGNTTVYGPVSIGAFDLNTDKIIHRYNLKSSDQVSKSLFANIVVDVVGDDCSDTYAYLTDLGGYALVVYSLRQNDSWKFSHNFFHIEPLLGNLYVGGVNFQWSDGIFGSALGPLEQDGYRTYYFHASISENQFSVNTRILQNKSVVTENNYYYDFKYEGYKGVNTSSLVAVFDEPSNTLITSQIKQDAVSCWNPKRKLSPESFNLIAVNHTTLLYINDIKLDENRNLWVLSDKLPIFLYSTLNPNEINYRILRAKVDDLINGTTCVV